MFAKKLAIFVLAISICHSFSVFSHENTNYEIFSHSDAYRVHVAEILYHLQERFPSLKDPQKYDDALELIVQIRCKELENPTKYQFVSSQDSRYFAYQVIAKEVYNALNESNFKNLKFLRYPTNTLAKTPDEFFALYPIFKISNTSTAECFDALPDVSYQLLSASFSIDTYVPADSALFVFLSGKGISQWFNTKEESLYHETFIQNVSAIFDNAGINQKQYQPYLESLINASPRTNEGIINQIFIPRENISNYLYVATPGGFFNVERNIDIDQTIEDFQKMRFTNFILKKNFQVRIIAGSLFDEDVTIYRYTLIPKNEQKSYRKFVKDTIHRILNCP